MSDETETAKDRTARAPVKGARALASVTTDLGLTAGFAWVGGVALHRGFGLSVPFVAAWLLLLGGMWLTQLVTAQLGRIWHHARVEADIELLAASMAAQDAIRQESKAGLADLLTGLAKDEKDSGAYL
jgi:hypothetical protein